MTRSVLLLLALSCRSEDGAPTPQASVSRTFPLGTTLRPDDDLAPWGHGTAFATGDFDGDSDPDLAVGQVGSVAVYLNDGGIGQRPDVGWSGAAPGYGRSLAVAGDLDGDGYEDLAVGCAPGAASPVVELHFGSAAGLPDASFVAIPDYDRAIPLGDFDGDGFPDLLLLNSTDQQLAYLLGGPAARAAVADPLWSVAYPAVIGASDRDGDGAGDIWVFGQPDTYWWYGGDLGTPRDSSDPPSRGRPARGPIDALTWVTPFDLTPLTSPDVADALVPGDLDRDGFVDLAYSVAGPTTTSVYLHLGDDQGPNPYPIQTLSGATSTAYGAALGSFDVDADGFVDLLIGHVGALGGAGEVVVLSGAPGDGDHDGDGAPIPDDCDDRDPAVSPTAADLPGVADRDCDGALDCYADADRDGHRTALVIAGNDLDCDDPGEAAPSMPADDCDDHAAATHPGATELPGDAVDQDCDGAELCFVDLDDDGFLASTATAPSADLDCTDAGEATAGTPTGDCADQAAAIFPGATELPGDNVDQDCDGAELCFVDLDDDGFLASTATAPSADGDCTDAGEATAGGPTGDCADQAAAIFPGATELPGDSVDQNCDGAELCFVDLDGDGFLASAAPRASADTDCRDAGEAAAGAPTGDCDDAAAASFPGAPELIGDDVDQDCDGAPLCYRDLDGDTEGAAATVRSDDGDCADPGESRVSTDCDDTNPARWTGAAEVPGSGVDANCDGLGLCLLDDDGDGAAGTTVIETRAFSCASPGLAPAGAPADCDDQDLLIRPGAPDAPGDGVDSDCTGGEACFLDADGDGYRSELVTPGEALACTPATSVTAALDCDDLDVSVSPDAVEVDADGVDADCDGLERCFLDADGDGQRGSALVDGDADCDDVGEALASVPAGDCDDQDAQVFLGAPEEVGVERDCDGRVLCYVDADGDSFRTTDTAPSDDADCDDPGEAYGAAALDCDDSDLLIGTTCVGGGTLCLADGDGDGVRTEVEVLSEDLDCLDPGEADATAVAGDCDDVDPAVYPGAAEQIGDGVDQDCDGGEACYTDADRDGFRPEAPVQSADLDCDDAGEAPITTPAGDCDDQNRRISPAAAEVAGGPDEDCDGVVLCPVDGDADGWPGAASAELEGSSCAVAGYTPVAGPADCDDADARFHPTAEEALLSPVDYDCDGQMKCYADLDGDEGRGAGFVLSADQDCEDPREADASAPLDCDDSTPTIYLGAPEQAGDGVDSDCDGGDRCYVDADGDGFRTSETVVGQSLRCNAPGEAPEGTSPLDCLDADADVHPFAADAPADGLDADCDGRERCYADRDGDGFRTTEVLFANDADCADPGEASAAAPAGDCADYDAARYPGADEDLLSPVDLNCDGQVRCAVDGDGDGFGTAATTRSTDGDCEDAGEVAAGGPTDCDDADDAVFPGATDAPGDGVDQDCDRAEACFVDADRDGWRTEVITASADADCADPGEALATAPADDCDDGAATVHPGAADAPADGLDADCDGVEACFADRDGDGFRTDVAVADDADCYDLGEALATLPAGDCDDDHDDIYPGATEPIGAGDRDCDGAVLCYVDADSDGWPVDATVASDDADCDDPGESAARRASVDCDDAVAAISPAGAEATGDGVDGDCDGGESCFADADGDGYRSPAVTFSDDVDCDDEGEALASAPGGDCDDAQASAFPGGVEVADDLIDQDCDGADLITASAGCGCDQSATPPWAMWIAGAAVALRRRRAS